MHLSEIFIDETYELLERYLDNPYDDLEEEFEKYGLTVSTVDQRITSTDDCVNAEKVIEVIKCGSPYYFRFEGLESSYECSYYTNRSKQVFPKQVMTTIYVENENDEEKD